MLSQTSRIQAGFCIPERQYDDISTWSVAYLSNIKRPCSLAFLVLKRFEQVITHELLVECHTSLAIVNTSSGAITLQTSREIPNIYIYIYYTSVWRNAVIAQSQERGQT